VLQNVRVLAIGNRLGETGTTGAPDDPNNPRTAVFATPVIATLEADSSGAEAIINAAMVGKLSLVLRSMTDFSAGTKTDAATDQSIRMTSPFWTK
jgi:pilus assembly protein CpaB